MLTVRKVLGVLVSLIALVGVLVTGVVASRRIDQRPRTDDAYLQGDLVHLAPDVSGRIVQLNVRDNLAVRKGDVLFRIDPEPYRMRVDQARAAVQGLEAKLGLTADQARTAQRTAQIALQQARLQADEARQAIINTKPTEAELEGARATLALAERDLNKTVVRAPCDGRITALDIAAGEFAATGHQLFTIIDTERWYAIGNFRETDLAGIEPGQRATVYVMAQPSRPVPGKVDSLGWGVASDVSATFGGLPHVERTLNWVRIAARFPVRVLLNAPPDNLMRYGATAVIVIDK